MLEIGRVHGLKATALNKLFVTKFATAESRLRASPGLSSAAATVCLLNSKASISVSVSLCLYLCLSVCVLYLSVSASLCVSLYLSTSLSGQYDIVDDPVMYVKKVLSYFSKLTD